MTNINSPTPFSEPGYFTKISDFTTPIPISGGRHYDRHSDVNSGVSAENYRSVEYHVDVTDNCDQDCWISWPDEHLDYLPAASTELELDPETALQKPHSLLDALHFYSICYW